MSRRARLALLAVVAVLPHSLKLAAYRSLSGYRIGHDVRIRVNLRPHRPRQPGGGCEPARAGENVGDEFWVIAGDRGDLSYVGVR